MRMRGFHRFVLDTATEGTYEPELEAEIRHDVIVIEGGNKVSKEGGVVDQNGTRDCDLSYALCRMCIQRVRRGSWSYKIRRHLSFKSATDSMGLGNRRFIVSDVIQFYFPSPQISKNEWS